MDNFIVSARKYRPATFDTVVGQLSITTTLKNAIRNNHLAQAFLFCGPRGVGKTTCARILAKAINCQHVSENTETCNHCESCKSFDAGNSFNIFELDGASNNSVDDVRGLIEQVRIPPQIGKYKVYIIDEVHMLSAAAFNAFLKTLEEPPAYAIFILATTEKHKIIPTILSRCQIFDFNRIQVEDIAKHLASIAQKENIQAEEDALHIIAQKADGALRDALSIFDQIVSFAGNTITYKSVIENLNILDYDYYFSLTNDLLSGNLSAVFLTFDEILNNGFDGHNFINGFSNHFRDLLVCRDEPTLKLLEVSPSIKEKYKTQALKCSPSFLFSLLDISNKCDVQYKAAKNQRLHVEVALIKMCTLNLLSTNQNTDIKKKVEPAAPVKIESQMASVTKAEEPKVAYKSTPPPTSSAKTFSISEKLNSQTKEEKENTADGKTSTELPSSTFTKADLLKAWLQYATLLKEQGKMSLYSTLIKREPELKDNWSVEFVLDNNANFNTEKNNLIEFLRKQLNNFSIQVSTILNKQQEESPIPYTTSEKFKKMAEKNPAINELKNRLDLELDF